MRELAMRRRQQAQITRLRASERFKDGIGKKRKRSAKMDEYENYLDFLKMNNMDEEEEQYKFGRPQKFQNQNWMFKNTGKDTGALE